MSGRWILSLMIAGCVAMAALFYSALKQSPEVKSQVTQQMQTEFKTYAHETKKVDRLKVAESGTETYSVDTQAPWIFEIQDKVLVVTTPQPESDKTHQPMPSELLPAARTSVQDFVWSWVDERFHSRKDLTVKIQFPGEPPQK